MKPQLTNHSAFEKSLAPKSSEANGGSKMFNHQKPNQFCVKGTARVLRFGLVILMATLCVVSCDKNPVSPGPGPNPGPSPDALSVSISANPTSGTAILTVHLSATVTGGSAPFTYAWHFGDGAGSTSANPSHTYTSAGTHNVSLIVTDASSRSDTATTQIMVSAPSGLVCSASAGNTNGPAPLAIVFTGGASGGSAPYTYRWNFGDGGTSNQQSPSHTYQSAGNYTAILSVTDASSANCSKTISISVTSPSSLNCAASADRTAGTAPLATVFTGSALGGTAPYRYNWNFGDGSVSNQQSPNHTYQTVGTFTVNLSVTDAASETCSKSLSVNVTPVQNLTCNASADRTSGTAPLAVRFSGSATGGTGPHNYLWNFGDGGTSSAASPIHTYQSAGNYTARLTVTDANSSTCTKTIAISITAAAGLECTASASPTSGRAPVSISFTGTATNGMAPYTYSWQFGDGGSSSQPNPSHTYQSAGDYNVRFTVTDASSATCTKTIAITAFDAPQGPNVSVPATSDGAFDVTVTYSWPTLASNWDRLELEESQSPNSGFTKITNSRPGSHPNPYTVSLTRSTGTYYYRARAYLGGGPAPGFTAYSAVKQITVVAAQPPNAPSNLRATASGNNITVTWQDNSSDETGFVLEASLSSSFASVDQFNLGRNLTSYNLTGTSNRTYYFRIYATGVNGNSARSNTASVTTQAASATVTITNNFGTTGTNQIMRMRIGANQADVRNHPSTERLEDDSYCSSLPGESVGPGQSMTFDVSQNGPNYYLHIGTGMWDINNQFYCSNGFSKKMWGVDYNTWDQYWIYSEIVITGHQSGDLAISIEYDANDNLVAKVAGNTIRFLVSVNQDPIIN